MKNIHKKQKVLQTMKDTMKGAPNMLYPDASKRLTKALDKSPSPWPHSLIASFSMRQQRGILGAS